jgi:hypothetical protein
MKYFAFIFFLLNSYQISFSQEKFKGFIDLGTIFKEDESKMRYFTIYNQSDTNREQLGIYSNENHQYFYMNGVRKVEYEDKLTLKAHDTLKIGYKFHDLNIKFKDTYSTPLKCNFLGSYPNNVYEYQVKYSLGRRLKLLTSKLILGDINIDETYTKQVLIKNISNKELIYTLDSNIFPKMKLIVPPNQNISFPIRFNYMESLINYGEFSIRLTNVNDTDYDYLIPIEFKAVSSNEKRPVIIFDSTHVTFIGIKGCENKKALGVKNAGNAPLLITNCSSSCGCIVADCPREPIMPGKKTTITVHYDTGRVGRISKTVTVISNDPITPSVTIKAIGEIFEDN